MAETCPLCAKRKGRRACLAKGETICPQCCGSKRLVLIDCPDDCVYLEAEGEDGRRKAPADRDLLAVLGGLEAGLAVEADASPTSFLDTVVRLVGRGAAAPFRSSSLANARLVS